MDFSRDNEKNSGGIIDVLFDKENTVDIVLVNENGQELAFKQVYASVKDNNVYCILAPIEDVLYLSKDGAFVFTLTQRQTFTVVKDIKICNQIFSEYYRALKRGGK